jgi:hypothetical protein
MRSSPSRGEEGAGRSELEAGLVDDSNYGVPDLTQCLVYIRNVGASDFTYPLIRRVTTRISGPQAASSDSTS